MITVIQQSAKATTVQTICPASLDALHFRTDTPHGQSPIKNRMSVRL